jgi:secreted PhoX family phosphatase
VISTSRRDFLKAGLLGAGVASLALVALTRYRRLPKMQTLPELMGPLVPVADETTGLPILMLPAGFRYQTISWAGSEMHDGRTAPGRADGMGVVRQEGARITLVRNHEGTGSSGAIGRVEDSYDVTDGGTTTLVFDADRQVLIDSGVSLSGTMANCAGGVTPWGTWLTCEEAVYSPALKHLPVPARQYLWDVASAQQEHGFVFEVPADGMASPQPIRAMGQFYHEAAAIDPRSGIVYLTEDTSPKAGFYRYVPEKSGILSAGGQLQMMRVETGRDMRDRLQLRQTLSVSWVDIPAPEQGFTPGNRDGNGVVSQGLSAGASAFNALEGCAFYLDRIYFTSKLGGPAEAGYVYEYDPKQEGISLVYESPGHDNISGPDNIIMSPRGSLVVCEDRVNLNRTAQSLDALTADGELFRFCQVNPRLEAAFGGHELGKTALQSEWAGVTFSLDGKWLFSNLYSPGVTIAITGPWQEGLI